MPKARNPHTKLSISRTVLDSMNGLVAHSALWHSAQLRDHARAIGYMLADDASTAEVTHHPAFIALAQRAASSSSSLGAALQALALVDENPRDAARALTRALSRDDAKAKASLRRRGWRRTRRLVGQN